MGDLDLKEIGGPLAQLTIVRPVGRVVGVDSGIVQVGGLNQHARVGDQIKVYGRDHVASSGEVVGTRIDGNLTVLMDDDLEGLAHGDRAVLIEPRGIFPHASWLGRIIDPNGRPMDGRPLRKGLEVRHLLSAPPSPISRGRLGSRFATGLAVFDTMLPIVRGQRVGVFAGSGVGKSTLMGDFARKISADVAVIAMVGERGRELKQFTEDTLGPAGLARSVVVAATSDASALTRRRCAWTAMAVAEHFRDAGCSVLLIADSITRFAEAHREVAAAAGEAPVLRGFPPSTAHIIASLCERAGPGPVDSGSITGIFSVLVAGSDMDEPIADVLRGVLDGHVVLDRGIAERGRFPAVDVLRSVSRSLPAAATESENDLIARARRLLGVYSENEMMLTSGLYSQGGNAEIDCAREAYPHLDTFFGRRHEQGIDHSFELLELTLRRAGDLPRKGAV
ncbi:MAG: FliI/YscN family ATPase [Pseudomonadota bacterium]